MAMKPLGPALALVLFSAVGASAQSTIEAPAGSGVRFPGVLTIDPATGKPAPSSSYTGAAATAPGTNGTSATPVQGVDGGKPVAVSGKVDQGAAGTVPWLTTLYQAGSPLSASNPIFAQVSGSVTATQGPAGTTPWKVDGSGTTQPISATALPLPAGASTAANQTAPQSAPGTAAGTLLGVQGGGSSALPIIVQLQATATVTANQGGAPWSTTDTNAATTITAPGTAAAKDQGIQGGGPNALPVSTQTIPGTYSLSATAAGPFFGAGADATTGSIPTNGALSISVQFTAVGSGNQEAIQESNDGQMWFYDYQCQVSGNLGAAAQVNTSSANAASPLMCALHMRYFRVFAPAFGSGPFAAVATLNNNPLFGPQVYAVPSNAGTAATSANQTSQITQETNAATRSLLFADATNLSIPNNASATNYFFAIHTSSSLWAKYNVTLEPTTTNGVFQVFACNDSACSAPTAEYSATVAAGSVTTISLPVVAGYYRVFFQSAANAPAGSVTAWSSFSAS